MRHQVSSKQDRSQCRQVQYFCRLMSSQAQETIVHMRDFIQATVDIEIIAKVAYGRSIEQILSSLVARMSSFDKEFIDENDYFLKFLGLQKQLYLKIGEEMNVKIIQSIVNTQKIIVDSHKTNIASAKKDISDTETALSEREKVLRK